MENKTTWSMADVRNAMNVLGRDYKVAFDNGVTGPIAMDAQLSSVTQPNAGIPSLFTTTIFPEITRAIITPMRAAEVYGERQAGDWTTNMVQFPFVESKGTVSAYHDYSQDGMIEMNANWETRQPWLYQTWTEWGERETAMMGQGNISLVAEKNIASISVLNKAQNQIYLFGVQGLKNYGVLNDPDLPPAIQPTTKTGGNTTWQSTSDPLDIYNDFIKLFGQLNDQMGGNVSMTDRLVVAIPTGLQQCLSYKNQYGLRIREMLKEDYPNIRIEALPELGSKLSNGKLSSNMMQMFIEEYEGMRTVFCGFTYKLRAHRMELYSTWQRQKKSQGAWGAVWRLPIACATMVGI